MIDDIKGVIRSLKEVGENLINQFVNNQMKLNPGKCHLLLNTEEQITLKIGSLHIKHSQCKQLLGINFVYKLNFAGHVKEICQKTSRNLNILARMALYMT